jgi:hypothetical protein
MGAFAPNGRGRGGEGALWLLRYQVALTADIVDAGGSIHDAILLLTPTSAPGWDAWPATD